MRGCSRGVSAQTEAPPRPTRGSAESDAGGAERDAGLDAPDAGRDAGLPGDAGSRRVVVMVSGDEDDGLWVVHSDGGTEERLSYAVANSDPYGTISSDSEKARMGFRFSLDVPRGAKIDAAALTIERKYLSDNSLGGEAISVDAWATGDVPAFDATHRHGPEAHGSPLFGAPVTGWLINVVEVTMVSQDLRALVQAVVDRGDWAPGKHIGFVATAAFTGPRYLQILDVKAAQGGLAELRVDYH